MEFYAISNLIIFFSIFIITLFIYKLYFLKHSLTHIGNAYKNESYYKYIIHTIIHFCPRNQLRIIFIATITWKWLLYWEKIYINKYFWMVFSFFAVLLWIYVISKKLLLRYAKMVDISTYDASNNTSIIGLNQATKHAILIVLWVLWVLIFLFLGMMWFLSAALW